MAELDTIHRPWRLTWRVEQADDEYDITLLGISDDVRWEVWREPQWQNKSHSTLMWAVWEMIEDGERFRPSAERCREAIERERADLLREDAERFAQ